MKFGEIDKIILLGGGELLRRFALMIKKSDYDLFVVTSERHSVELGLDDDQKLSDFLKKQKIRFIIANDIHDKQILSEISSRTLGISKGAAWIFKKSFIDKFEGRLINLHGTPLPDHRGGGGFSWRIMMGDNRGCSLIHMIDEGIDTGDIVKRKNYKYPKSCRNPVDFEQYDIEEYLKFLKEFMVEVKKNKDFRLQKQDESRSVYWPRLLTSIHGYIDWTWNAIEIERFISAFGEPYSGAITFLNDKKVFLRNCRVEFKKKFHPFQVGLVYRVYDGKIYVAAKSGSLILGEIIDEDNNNIIEKLRAGDRFFTPLSLLEEAKKFRAIYTPTGLKK